MSENEQRQPWILCTRYVLKKISKQDGLKWLRGRLRMQRKRSRTQKKRWKPFRRDGRTFKAKKKNNVF